mmetsp:Transcript_32894/g.94628  ORF Transcript_32894/g.94628 Transcript_32894/m.94628 type:complete len:307 (-) Transcript_32894:457-1377(-)
MSVRARRVSSLVSNNSSHSELVTMTWPPEMSHTRQGRSWCSCIFNTLAMSNFPWCSRASRVSELKAPGDETKKFMFFLLSLFLRRRATPTPTLTGSAGASASSLTPATSSGRACKSSTTIWPPRGAGTDRILLPSSAMLLELGWELNSISRSASSSLPSPVSKNIVVLIRCRGAPHSASFPGLSSPKLSRVDDSKPSVPETPRTPLRPPSPLRLPKKARSSVLREETPLPPPCPWLIRRGAGAKPKRAWETQSGSSGAWAGTGSTAGWVGTGVCGGCCGCCGWPHPWPPHPPRSDEPLPPQHPSNP